MTRIDLFICHVTEDRTVANDLVGELEKRGLQCWFAPRDINGGRPYDDAIADALEDCRAMLLVFSDRCNDSDYIRREVTVAGENGKLVIPLRIEDAKPRKGLKVRLADLHWIDAFVERERALDQLVATLGKLGAGTAASHDGSAELSAATTPPVQPPVGLVQAGPSVGSSVSAAAKQTSKLPLAAALSALVLAGVGYWGYRETTTTAAPLGPSTKPAVASAADSGVPPNAAASAPHANVEPLVRAGDTTKPKLVTADDPAFFDPVNGQPIVWYHRTASGEIELYDAKGFHPRSGESLAAVTRDVVDAWRAKHMSAAVAPAKPPQPVDPKSYAFFDPVSGTPRVWYWKVRDDQYEFFDGPGFHPTAGEALALADKAFVAAYKREQDEREGRLRAEAKEREDRLRAETEAKAARDRQDAEAKANRERQEAEAKVVRERLEAERRAEEQRRLAEEQRRLADERRRQVEAADRERREQADREEQQRRRELEIREAERRAGDRCDELAGNPTDQRHKGEGVPYEILKLQVRDAIDVCTKAVALYPNEVRYQYQLARATQMIDKARAFELQKRVAAQRYAAAFDNLGWLYVSLARNKDEAVRQFKVGVQLGDPDCMLSLAEMVDQKAYLPADPLREKIALYKRAAELGHPRAQRALEIEVVNFQQQQQQLQTQQQIQQQVLGLFGAALIGAMNKR